MSGNITSAPLNSPNSKWDINPNIQGTSKNIQVSKVNNDANIEKSKNSLPISDPQNSSSSPFDQKLSRIVGDHLETKA